MPQALWQFVQHAYSMGNPTGKSNRAIFLLQAWLSTHTNNPPLPLSVSCFFLFSSSLEFWHICTHLFSRLPFCFQRNPFRLAKAKAKCGWFLLWGVAQCVFVSVCMGSDLWPFFKLTTGHRPSSPHAKTNGLSPKLNVTLALSVCCSSTSSFSWLEFFFFHFLSHLFICCFYNCQTSDIWQASRSKVKLALLNLALISPCRS